MIKLNNKKITYVALADSNNSVKGVKEIWYADSNNSVKLVYRRKDALIEGEDYEKYHWLEGRNGAYINTEHRANTGEDAFIVKGRYDGTLRNPLGNEQSIFGVVEKWSYSEDAIWCYTYIDNGNQVKPILLKINAATAFPDNVPLRSLTKEFVAVLKNSNSDYYAENNGIGALYSNLGVADKTMGNVYLFTRNTENIPTQAAERYFQGDIAYFRITDPTFTIDKLHLIPCKLLKPVPKWLDANGIRRNVGECGMIDLVSGKFYGNVNSVGTFTVENYYERKEWLIGDGSAYIDTGHNVNEDLDYETNVHLLPDTYLFWYRSGSPYYDQTMVARSNTINTGVRIAKNSNDIRSSDTANVEVQWNNNEVLVNGVNYIPGNRATTFNYGLYLFRAYLADTSVTNYSSNNVKCSYFRFLDSNRNYIQNLIPCTLTMDLPASMDANNIARTKGTSGMWDLVSDRFYGNVANSGTFKAVNLAEGVDYEVHQWLVATIPVGVSMMSLSLDTNDFYYKRKWHIFGNVSYFSTDTHAYFTHYSNRKVAVYDKSTGDSVVYGNSIDADTEIVIDSNSSRSLINNIDVPMYGDTATSILFQNAANGYNTAELSTSAITVDGSVRYIPVKLLKSIPAKYDANGIARQAGECGMYDTVNDVFYGNVASSGTFTVSDN